jgi:hypothetical protein
VNPKHLLALPLLALSLTGRVADAFVTKTGLTSNLSHQTSHSGVFMSCKGLKETSTRGSQSLVKGASNGAIYLATNDGAFPCNPGDKYAVPVNFTGSSGNIDVTSSRGVSVAYDSGNNRFVITNTLPSPYQGDLNYSCSSSCAPGTLCDWYEMTSGGNPEYIACNCDPEFETPNGYHTTSEYDGNAGYGSYQAFF